MQTMKINIFSPKIQNILFDYSQEVTMEQGLRVESQVFSRKNDENRTEITTRQGN